jgi:hypothetical protein
MLLLFGLDKLLWALVLNFIIKIKMGIGCRADGILIPHLQQSPARWWQFPIFRRPELNSLANGRKSLNL